MIKIPYLLGINGIPRDENPIAIRAEKYFSFIIIFLILTTLFIAEDTKNHLHYRTESISILMQCIRWLFAVELITLTIMVNKKVQFLLSNWLLVLITVAVVTLLHFNLFVFLLPIKTARLALIIIMTLPSMSYLTRYFFDQKLWTTFVCTGIIAVLFGLIAASVDPNIHSSNDGIWWALATITTIGYGDIVPVSLIGRIIGILLAGIGLGVFVAITANFLTLIQRKEKESASQENTVVDETDQNLHTSLEEIKKEYRIISEKLDILIKKNNNKNQSS